MPARSARLARFSSARRVFLRGNSRNALVSRGLGLSESTVSNQSIFIFSRSGRTAQRFGTATFTGEVAHKSDKQIAAWLLGTAGAVFGMVVLGGVTRLTRSGLSMVDWRPEGSMLPRTDEEWRVEFEKYKRFPEFKRINQSMDIEEFKFIYFLEWAHRMWGRALGVIFAVPLAGFLLKGRIKKTPAKLPTRLPLLLLMGGSQGLVGWWMVKSGLEEPKDKRKDPRVSPYRLAAHLTMAVGLYSGLLWTGFTCMHPNRLAANAFSSVPRVRMFATSALGLVGTTMLSGAFVAGNDAGHAYNDWPFYAGRMIPEDVWDPDLKPQWRNYFETTGTVQFDHRNLAYITAPLVWGTYALARKNPATLPPAAVSASGIMAGFVAAQVGLGITTLMSNVPVWLGSAHQAGALTVYTSGIYLLHTLRYVR